MPPRYEVQRVKKLHDAEFIGRSGVTGVATGFKIVKGQVTDELAIRVYVEKKRDVPADQRIPKEINGIKTDVIQRRFVAHPLRVKLSELKAMADTGTYDPLRGGISIGPCRVVNGYIYVGTLGLIAIDNPSGDHMMLSNFHVMCVDNNWSVGNDMSQPSRVDGGSCPSDVVGQLQRAVLVGSTAGNGPGVDGAVASIVGRTVSCNIVDIGDVNGKGAASVGQAVRKRGRTTGLTYGTVDSIDLTVNIDYGDGIGVVTLIDQIGIDVDASQSMQFGIGGDSGSAVVDNARNVVGLYYGGNQEEVDANGNIIVQEGIYGVANPIQAVLDALDISLCVPKRKPEKLEIKEKLEKFEKKEIKEFKHEKFEKPEKKEFKDLKYEKIEKPEIKEKVEYWEPKGFLEPKEIREPKGILEPKGLLEPKDIREPKDFLEPKEIRETKGLFEEKVSEVRPVQPIERGSMEARVAQLEATVNQLSHFIRTELRPDLTHGALKNEPDVAGRGGPTSFGKLQKEAKDAKESKDAKDTEKPREA